MFRDKGPGGGRLPGRARGPESHLPKNPEAIEPAKQNLADEDGQHDIIYGREQLIVCLHGKQRKKRGAAPSVRAQARPGRESD